MPIVFKGTEALSQTPFQTTPAYGSLPPNPVLQDNLIQTPLLQTGKVVEKRTYKVGAFIPFIKTNTKANITLQAETGITDSTSANAIISLGAFTSITGGYKWIPYPDIESQPAIGAIFYINYYPGDFTMANVLRLLAGPIISKEIDFSSMALNLYSSVLVILQNAETKHRLSVHLGAETTFESLENFSFLLEWGFGFGNLQNGLPRFNTVGTSNTVILGASMVF